MQQKYRMYQRENGTFYWQEVGGTTRGSLHTKDREEAKRLLHAKNESHRQPIFNMAMARTYAWGADPKIPTRTWQAVMDEMATHGIETTRERCARAFASQAYDSIRNKPLVETRADDLLAIVHGNGNTVAHYLRRVHNLAVNLGWLPWPILVKNVWPKIRSCRKRAVTAEEHAKIVERENNAERRAYYELLYETGASQTDAANLDAKNIDWRNNVLVYRRKKLGSDSEPARLTIGTRLRQLLLSLPQVGPLFPKLRGMSANHRAAEFRRRCRLLVLDGISLHSYRHSWAQRAKACGYPQRFAQEALGHTSRAVHEAYARGAQVICPPLEDYEKVSSGKVITIRSEVLRITC